LADRPTNALNLLVGELSVVHVVPLHV